jgi:hypothetical protein
MFLITFCIYCKKKLHSDIARTSALIMVAFSPLYWDIKNSVVSDIPLLMFVYVGLLLSDKIETLQQEGHNAIVAAIAFGVVAYLAYGTRSLGLFVIVAFFISQLYNRRGLTSAAFCSALVFSTLFVWQSLELHTDKSYIDSMGNAGNAHASGYATNYLDVLYRTGSYLLKNVMRNLVQYLKEVKWYWESGSNTIIAGIATVATGLLCGLGFIKTIRESVSAGEAFFVVYSLFLLAVPFFQGTRYLIPVFPMYAIYIFKGFDYSLDQGYLTIKYLLYVTTIAFVIGTYLVNYYRIDYSPYQYGIATKTSQEMFDYIKNETPRDSLIAFQKPRAMALLGERKSVSYFYNDGNDFESIKLINFLKDIKATHVVTSNGVWGDEESEGYVNWAKTEKVFLVEKFHNKDFSVYAVR